MQEPAHLRNSFLDSPDGQKVLVIVPHEDDEINVAGAVISAYAAKGAEVIAAFTTNGDFSFCARTRMREAAASLAQLGAHRAIFLGYGDTGRDCPTGHFYYAEEPVTSPAGHRETYGTEEYPDFAYAARGSHSPYTREAVKCDLRELILSERADILFCVDYDVHPDHRATSILFEEVMGEILHTPGNTYHPAVFKGFAYATSFGAAPDFYTRNILSVQKPMDDALIDTSLYTWESRVRFPVSPSCRGHFLCGNQLYHALFQHKSQAAGLHAIRVANGDAVFWERRTDSLSYQAHVSASSGDAAKATDFKLLSATDIDSITPVFSDYLWKPDGDDAEKCLVFRWDEPQTIRALRLYGSIGEGRITKLEVSFDTGWHGVFGPQPGKGTAWTLSPAQQDIRACTLRILDAEGDYGISECEIFGDEPNAIVPPFLKICIGEDFAYDYLLPAEEDTCRLAIYAYPGPLPVRFSVLEGRGKVSDDGLVRFDKGETGLLIRAEAKGDPPVYDEVLLRRCSAPALFRLSVCQWLEKHLLDFYLRKHRKWTHIRHKYLKQL